MKDINEYNYKDRGYKKFFLSFTIKGYQRERDLITFARTESQAKKNIKSLFKNNRLRFTYLDEV